MIVLVLVVAPFVAFRDVNRTEPENTVEAVDFGRPAEYAREQARFDRFWPPPSSPRGGSPPASASTNGRDQTWHLGLLTDGRRYVGLEQADESAEKWSRSSSTRTRPRATP